MAYRYAPLDNSSRQIRLLSLEPAHGLSTDIYGSLSTANFRDDATVYGALSYTWFDNRKTHLITIDGRSLPITANLHGVLLRLRSIRSRTLWIDAICINQDDDQERSAQVLIMRYIYGRAAHVVIWLGEDSVTEDGRIGIEFLASTEWKRARNRCENKSRKLRRAERSMNTPDNNVVQERCKMEVAQAKQLCTVEGAVQAFNATRGVKDRLTIENLNEFLARPWFSRRWVIQEAYVAKHATAMCGTYCLPWRTICTTHRCSALDNDGYQCNKRNSNIAVALHLSAKRNFSSEFLVDPGDILEAMIRFENFACQDPRDLIGAILSLWPSLGYRIDYTLDSSTNYFLFAKSLVDAGRLIDVLDSAILCRQRPGTDDTTLPAWVPDWRRLGRSDGGHRDTEEIVLDHGCSINPSSGIQPAWVPDWDWRRLGRYRNGRRDTAHLAPDHGYNINPSSVILPASVTDRRTVELEGVMVGIVAYGLFQTFCYNHKARIVQRRMDSDPRYSASCIIRELEDLDWAVKGDHDPEDVIALLPSKNRYSLYTLRREKCTRVPCECAREHYKVVTKADISNAAVKRWWKNACPQEQHIEIV
ncbi:hypothetical protein LTR37_021154 [Vermiconidia calcicola]|uniref:Uncharacterized protein n=1 Tax=Vermiconidia calcicola TaxID=1690605 RepID=A0ACC3M9H3_9PEZI|nr:hypothetical protein LTR37_021154 [Vermiconidia calcicola]